MGFIKLLVATAFAIISLAFLINGNATTGLFLGIVAAILFASNKRKEVYPYARERFQEPYRRR